MLNKIIDAHIGGKWTRGYKTGIFLKKQQNPKIGYPLEISQDNDYLPNFFLK